VREFNDFASQAAAGGERRKLKNFSCPGHGVILGDHPLITKAETASHVEGAGQRTKIRDRLRRRLALRKMRRTLSLAFSATPVESRSPSFKGDSFWLQLWGDIILEHLHFGTDICLDKVCVVNFTRCYFLSPTWPCAVARWLSVCSRRGREVHSKFLSAIMDPLPQAAGFLVLCGKF
jgi:hypothetical protein